MHRNPRGPARGFVPGIKYEGKHAILPSGERIERRSGKDGDPSYHDFEVEERKVNGHRAFMFPEGVTDPGAKRHGGSGRAMAPVVTMRILALALRDRYAPAVKFAEEDLPVPIIHEGDTLHPNVAARYGRPVVIGKRPGGRAPKQIMGVYYPWFTGPGGDPRMVMDPPFYTTELVDDAGRPMIVEGWSGVMALVVKKGAHKGEKVKCPAAPSGALPRGWPKDTRIVKIGKNEGNDEFLPILEVRAKRLVPKKENGKPVLEGGKPVYVEERVDDLVGKGLIRFGRDGAWELKDRSLIADTVYAVLPALVSDFQFLVKTSKMGCASWNLPAGPFRMPVEGGTIPFGGTCVAATPMNLFERYGSYSEGKAAAKLEDGEQPPLQLPLLPVLKYREFREKMGHALVRESHDADARVPGMQSNVSPYKDTLVVRNVGDRVEKREMSPEEVANEGDFKQKLRRESKKQEKAGVPAGQRDSLEWGLICSYCYALKSNYAYLNQQFFQSCRHGWAEAALEVDATGRALAGGDPGKSAFVAMMVEVLKAYNAPHREATRLQHAEDPRFFRIHDAGDVFSPAYAQAWNEVARRLPHVKFWMPTRMWMKDAYRTAFTQAPSNFVIRPSALHFQDAAPVVPGCAAGSTGNPAEQIRHYNCPASSHDRGSCIGGLSVAPIANKKNGVPPIMKAIPKRETACRVCWGGHPYLKSEVQSEIAHTPVSYKEH